MAGLCPLVYLLTDSHVEEAGLPLRLLQTGHVQVASCKRARATKDQPCGCRGSAMNSCEFLLPNAPAEKLENL